MRNGNFRVANSRNSHPAETFDCDAGPLPVNRYPVRVYNSDSPILLGGRFEGEVPQSSDWIYTYCNSAAVGLWDSPFSHVEGLRVRRVWDGIRFARSSGFFLLDSVWLSEVRDDCVENDFLLGGMIKDSLLDGCFSAVSLRAPEDALPDDTKTTVTFAGVLMRLQPYLYKGIMRQGFPLKGAAASPRLAMYDSIIAMGSEPMINPATFGAALARVKDCRNNLFLWTSNEPLAGRPGQTAVMFPCPAGRIGATGLECGPAKLD